MYLNSAGRVKELIRFQARPCRPEIEIGLYDIVKVITGIPCAVTKLGSSEKLLLPEHSVRPVLSDTQEDTVYYLTCTQK